MVELRELEPAQLARTWSEKRLNKTALAEVEQMRTALVVCDYNGKPFPVTLSTECYDYIVALLVQRSTELV